MDEARNRSECRAAASAAHGGSKKYGWRTREWCYAVGCSRAFAYQLLAQGRLRSVKLGRSRLIVDHPQDFLARLEAVAVCPRMLSGTGSRKRRM
jgi:excisionase family DNA binding protein